MNYKKTITMLAVMATSLTAIAQTPNTEGVSISSGVTPPHPSAMLDVSSSNKGVLIPRVRLTGLGDQTTVLNPETSLLVYNEGTAIAKGYYFWDGTNWSPLGGGATNNGFWQQSTYQANDIYTWQGGFVGIGNDNPIEHLQIGDEIVIHDGGTKLFGRNFDYTGTPISSSNNTGAVRMISGFSTALSINIFGTISLDVSDLQGAAGSDIYFCSGLKVDNDCHVYTTYPINTPSDSNLKMNISEIQNCLSVVSLLKPKKYNMKGSSDNRFYRGFLAQDMEQVLPDLVNISVDGENPVKGISYSELIPILTGAIQEQQATITTLQATVNSLLERVQVLENQ